MTQKILFIGPCYRWNMKGSFPLSLLIYRDKREVQFRKRTVVQLKVQWKHFEADEATWENEGTMKNAYPTLFHDIISNP